jgi:signal transduction histidine kinase
MKELINPSVGRRLAQVVIILQLVSLLITVLLAGVFFVFQRTPADSSLLLLDRVVPYIQREADGSLSISAEGFSEMAFQSKDFWVYGSDGTHSFNYGPIPQDVQPFLGKANSIIDKFGAIDHYDTPVGNLTLIAGGGKSTSLDIFIFMWFLLRDFFLFIFVPGAVLSIFVIPRIVRYFLNPIALSADAANRLQPELTGQRLPTKSAPSEVLPLISAVNSALTRIDDWTIRQRRFIADAAHELRTPITVLQVRLDALPAGELADALREDCRRLARLAERLLAIERIRAVSPLLEAVDLNVISRNAALEFTPLALRGKIDLSFEHAPSPVMIKGNAESVHMCLMNLLENALRHGGRKIVVAVSDLPMPRVTVKDSGKGVHPDLADRLFEPFVSTSSSAGAGLGLALVSEVMKALDGSVFNQTGPDGMTHFVLEFSSLRKAPAR